MNTNKWIGTGRMVKDPELKFTQGKGNAVVTFTIAVDDGFGDKKTTDFIPVVVWGKAAEAVANNCAKGSKVLVNGKIKTRNYEGKNGRVYVTEVVAEMFGGIEFLDSKGSGQASPQQGIPEDYFGGTEVNNDDMPF